MGYKNIQDRRDYLNKWRKDNPDKVKAIDKRSKINCKGRIQQYYQDNKDTIRYNQKLRNKINRKKALDMLGGRCEICNIIDDRMEFHHITYAEDSVSVNREREVIKHPERFMLLCWVCHRLLTFGQEYPERVESVLNHIKDNSVDKD